MAPLQAGANGNVAPLLRLRLLDAPHHAGARPSELNAPLQRVRHQPLITTVSVPHTANARPTSVAHRSA
ncbi:hypothetical protein [Burkholderia glumae]|uniref:hypothetical protein n=1 Tax=Burkholderia glumae TaxID=337 RepID=UPI002150A5A5|nr:hypothetical protein [Burkholderia glumae]UVT05853.1 hypothetical protein EFP20_30355 [Burkholderia glumae]